METALTKSAQKTLSVIYKAYVKRCKHGESQAASADFNDLTRLRQEHFPDADLQSLQRDLNEISKKFGIRRYIRSGIILNDEAITYMEALPKNTARTVIDIVAKFIP